MITFTPYTSKSCLECDGKGKDYRISSFYDQTCRFCRGTGINPAWNETDTTPDSNVEEEYKRLRAAERLALSDLKAAAVGFGPDDEKTYHDAKEAYDAAFDALYECDQRRTAHDIEANNDNSIVEPAALDVRLSETRQMVEARRDVGLDRTGHAE